MSQQLSPGAYLCSCREAAGLTQIELSEQSGLRQSKISDLERGKAAFRLQEIRALARALPKLDLNRLVRGGDHPSTNSAGAA